MSRTSLRPAGASHPGLRGLTATAVVAALLTFATAPVAASDPADGPVAVPRIDAEDGQLTLDLTDIGEDDADVTLSGTRWRLPAATAEALGTETGYLLEHGTEVVIDTSGLAADEVVGGLVRLTLTEVDGPGEVAIATTDGEEVTGVASSLRGPGNLDVTAAEATPAMWTVTTPGTYAVTLEAAASLPGGRTSTAEEVLTFEVPDPAPARTPSTPRPDHRAATAEPSPEPPVERDAAPEPAPEPAPSPSQDDTPQVRAMDLGEAVAEPGTAPASADGEPFVLDVGHTDAFSIDLVDGALVMAVKDDTFLHADQVVYRDPADVLFQVLPQAATEIPDDASLAFLGTPGDTVHLLPLTQDPALLWPGWSTERMSSSAVDGSVRLRITGVDGPGDLKIFTSSTFGGNTVLVDSEDGLPDAWNVAVPAHVHANWVFTETGRYRLTVDAQATLANGTSVSTGDVTYTWHVGDLDDDGPGGGGGGGTDDGADGDGDGDSNGGGGLGGAADDGDGSGDGEGGSRGSLARTGTSTAALVAFGALLVLVGVASVRSTRTWRRPGARPTS